mgnify:CR=1 FL=1
MHEMSLAEHVREIIEDAAGAQGFRQVRRIVLEIGELAAVETDALQFCLDVVLEGSVAEGAALEFAKRGIRVNTIFPGQIRTPILADITPEQDAAIKASIPMGEVGDPIVAFGGGRVGGQQGALGLGHVDAEGDVKTVGRGAVGQVHPAAVAQLDGLRDVGENERK